MRESETMTPNRGRNGDQDIPAIDDVMNGRFWTKTSVWMAKKQQRNQQSVQKRVVGGEKENE
jgi:hypothetical protein